MLIRVSLPFPPTTNNYWRNVNGMVKISRKGREYRGAVQAAIWGKESVPPGHKVRMELHAFPPDRRKRDVDNIQKSILDSLEKGGMFDDDNCVRDLRTIFYDHLSARPGEVCVIIQDFACPSWPMHEGV